jgi:hypothetical protein
MIDPNDLYLKGDDEFEKERHKYCREMYELELKWEETLQKRAEFYYGAFALFLGAIFIKGALSDAVTVTSDVSIELWIRWLVALELFVLIGASIAILYGLLKAFRVELSPRPYPMRFTSILFEPSERGGDASANKLIRKIALRLAAATEASRMVNAERWRHLETVLRALIVFLLTFLLLEGTVAAVAQ